MALAIAQGHESMDLKTWLSVEIAEVEARLQNTGPTCHTDRQGITPPSMKETEGRYFALRRAARLLEQGQSLDPLPAEADKAHAFLAADAGLARNRAWTAYFAGVLKAIEEVSLQAGAAQGGRPL